MSSVSGSVAAQREGSVDANHYVLHEPARRIYIYILIFYFVDCFHLPSGCVLYEVPSPEVFPRDDITELSSVTNEDC